MQVRSQVQQLEIPHATSKRFYMPQQLRLSAAKYIYVLKDKYAEPTSYLSILVVLGLHCYMQALFSCGK